MVFMFQKKFKSYSFRSTPQGGDFKFENLPEKNSTKFKFVWEYASNGMRQAVHEKKDEENLEVGN